MPDVGDPVGGLLGPLLQGQSLVHGIIPPSVPLGAGGPPLVPPTVASTRFPTAVNRVADPVTTLLHSGDVPAFLADKIAPGNLGLLSSYPGMAFLKGATPQQTFHAAAKRMADNMTEIYSRSPKIMQQVSPQWYFGGHRIVSGWAEKFGLPKQSVAAATAVLSPSKDWFENVSMAERITNILHTKGAMAFSSQMADKAREIYTKPAQQTLLREIQGKRLNQLETPEQKAAWIRLYDEAHNPRHFRTVAPDGGLGPYMLNEPDPKTGIAERATMAWQSNDNIAKAVRALESGGDMKVISPLLGERHKVRNFYNNLMHPELRIGVTGDTHQVASGLLSPLGQGDPAVLHHLQISPKGPEARAALGPAYRGAGGSSVTGFRGTYPVVEEATRLAAERTGMLPHMMQSGTWEPTRTLFANKSLAQKQIVSDIWGRVDRGLLSPARARDMIFRAAGGVREPPWVAGGLLYDPRHVSTY